MLKHIKIVPNENVLVGFSGSDDAAVFRLNEDTALISTLDFFTPMDDDPYMFGQIAAANSLSDVYAMGGKPILALNIVCFPACEDMDVLGEILRGGADKVAEAGAVVTGGHSVDDKEIKYGLSVTGLVHPNEIWRNTGAQPGDVLILTKAIGTGVMNTAMKGNLLSEDQRNELVQTMARLNKYAAEAIKRASIPVNACTDITGFGLLGHLLEMLGETVSATVSSINVPLLSGAQEMASMGIVPAGAYRNLEHVEKNVCFENKKYMHLLADPQTSGGLLISVPAAYAEKAIQVLESECPKIIGTVVPRREYAVYVQ